MHVSDSTDLSLLQRIAARDTGALAELYDRRSRLLFSLILRIIRDRAEAEEILQEAFVRVWTRAEIYDARMGGPLPWILRVARNCAIDRLRIEEPFASERIALVREVVPAETALRKAAIGELDGVVCMFHDQATIASKILDWGTAVNVTWGLPFVRTSVDHGVAYDAARAGVGDPEGMIAAARMARVLAGSSS